MEEINQNSQTSLDFNADKFAPKEEIEIQQIIKHCFKKNLPIEIVGSQTKRRIGKQLQCAKTLDMSNYFHPSHLTLKRIESKSLGQGMSYQKMKNAILKGIDSIRTE